MRLAPILLHDQKDMAEQWPKRRGSPSRVPHPNSPAGKHFDWSSLGVPHPDSPAGRHFDWSSLGVPHPNSPAAWRHDWGNVALDIGLLTPGWGRPLLLQIINYYLKLGPPFSAALLEHYVGGSGEPYNLGNIPDEWQSWIVKWTKAKPGRHHLDPYNMHPFILDLKNSLGHFDVVVTEIGASGVKRYEIEKDSYHFGFTPNDKDRRGQHGLELPSNWSDSKVHDLQSYLPTTKYMNPGGFSDDAFEIRRVHGRWTLFVPQDVAARAGKPFKVYGKFETSLTG